MRSGEHITRETDVDTIATEQDDLLRDGLRQANIPTLLMVLVQLTGDRRWLEEPFRPVPARGMSDNDDAGLTLEAQQTIRRAALDAIQAWQSGKPPALDDPDPDLLLKMLEIAMAEPIPPAYAAVIQSEVRAAGTSRADEVWPTAPAGFTALIIGAGVSGLCAAIKLRELGVQCRVIEKNSSVGGTWLENRYPGCGVDTPSHIYSFSFSDGDWTRYFAAQGEVHQYLERIADDYDIRSRVEFNSEVTEARWDDDEHRWVVGISGPDGSVTTAHADIVISAVGALNRPKIPAINGIETFTGPWFHTSDWPDDIDLRGKRVAVIGTGASAMQVVPAIVDQVESLTVFQRSPQWVAPFEKFHVDIPDGIRALMRAVPLYRAWYRVRLAWMFGDKVHAALQKDPNFEFPERAVNALNDAQRRGITRHMQNELADRADLIPLVLPSYPPFGKRMLLDNGWFRALKQPHVELITGEVNEINHSHVITGDDRAREVDVIVFATGFMAAQFLMPMEIRGRSGVSLRETWDSDDARAYLGTTVPDFPNFFVLYGPNTQPGHGGSYIAVAEAQMQYVTRLLAEMFADGVAVIECRRDIFTAYNEDVDQAHSNMIWTHPGMSTYYRNARGRVVFNSPWKLMDYWHMTRTKGLADYHTEPRDASPRGL